MPLSSRPAHAGQVWRGAFFLYTNTKKQTCIHPPSASPPISHSLSFTHTHASVKASHIPTSVEALCRNWMELPRLSPAQRNKKQQPRFTRCFTLLTDFFSSLKRNNLLLRFSLKKRGLNLFFLLFLMCNQVGFFLDARILKARVYNQRGHHIRGFSSETRNIF